MDDIIDPTEALYQLPWDSYQKINAIDSSGLNKTEKLLWLVQKANAEELLYFYDELEAAAVKKVHSSILYFDEQNKEKSCEGFVVDFIHINKAEYLVLKDGFKLRLDKIIQFNDILAPSTSSCSVDR